MFSIDAIAGRTDGGALKLENYVVLVSAGYDIKSFIVDPTGEVLAEATARAIENQIFLVTSVWNNKRIDWLKTGIYGYDGKLLDFVEGRGVAVAEVDLDAPRYWAHIGDLKGQLTRQRPAVSGTRSEAP